MAQRKKKKKKAKRRGKKRSWRPSLPEIDFSTWRQHVRAAIWLLAAMGLVAGWILGVPRLEAVAGQRTNIGAMEIAFTDPPAWVDGELRDYLARTVHSHVSGDPFQHHELLEIHRTLMATGIFRDVRQVRRTSASRIEIDAPFIEPYALVRNREGDFLIDRQGRLMHPSIQPAGNQRQKSHRFVMITGAFFDRPETLAHPWPGTDIEAALRLLGLLDERPWRGQVTEVDLSQFQRSESLLLITDRGGEIIWGSAPDDEGVREVAAEQKLAYLDRHYRDYKHIDRGCHRLNITGDVVSCQ